jgi:hypothetical protein
MERQPVESKAPPFPKPRRRRQNGVAMGEAQRNPWIANTKYAAPKAATEVAELRPSRGGLPNQDPRTVPHRVRPSLPGPGLPFCPEAPALPPHRLPPPARIYKLNLDEFPHRAYPPNRRSSTPLLSRYRQRRFFAKAVYLSPTGIQDPYEFSGTPGGAVLVRPSNASRNPSHKHPERSPCRSRTVSGGPVFLHREYSNIHNEYPRLVRQTSPRC